MPQKHLLFERVKCGFANHAENESIDQYIVRLRQLVESREFENLCESLLRERLVIGPRDTYTRDRLLRAERPVPRLARYIGALCASELSRIYTEQFKDTTESPNTVHVAGKHHSAKEKRKENGGSNNRKLRCRNKPRKEQPSGLCKFCGTKHPYMRGECLASGKTCYKCGKQCHFTAKCHVERQYPGKPDIKSSSNKWSTSEIRGRGSLWIRRLHFYC